MLTDISDALASIVNYLPTMLQATDAQLHTSKNLVNSFYHIYPMEVGCLKDAINSDLATD